MQGIYSSRQIDIQLCRSCSLTLLTLKITLTAQPVLLYMCTQQYHSDHCLPAKASLDICCHSVVSQSLSFSATVSKAFSEPQDGTCTQHSFSSRWKVNKHAHLDIWSSIYTVDGGPLGHFPKALTLLSDSFCLWLAYYLYMEVSSDVLRFIWYNSFFNCHLKTKTLFSEYFLNLSLNI